MKVLHTLVLFGALCACSLVFGQSSRILESFRYRTIAFESSVQPANSVQWIDISFREVKAQDVLVVPPFRILNVKVSIVPDSEVFFPPISTEKDLLSGSLLRSYRNGMIVDLPFFDMPMTVYIRSGLSWDIGKHSRFVFPSFSRVNGFKFTKSF